MIDIQYTKKKINLFHDRKDEMIKNSLFFAMCFLALLGSFFITARADRNSLVTIGNLTFSLNGICFFKLLTGYNCPVCGMTRCFAYISHGHFIEAYNIGHAGIFVYLLCVFETFYRALRIIFGYSIRVKAIRVIEIILVSITCFMVVFFFIAQFFDPSIIIKN